MSTFKVIADKFQISLPQAQAVSATVALLKDLINHTNFQSKYAVIYMEVIIDGLADGDEPRKDRIVNATRYLLDNIVNMVQAKQGEAMIQAQDKAEDGITPEQLAQLVAEAQAAILKAGGSHGLN